jgi:hypothetical protein
MTWEHVIVHDSRIEGRIYPRANIRVIHANENTTRAYVAQRIRDYAADPASRQMMNRNRLPARRPLMQRNRLPVQRPFPILTLIGHGVRVTNSPSGIRWALEIGDYIHADNALEFGRSIRGCVSDRIRLLGCNAVDNEDGNRTCRGISVGAEVRLFASSTVQNFTVSGGHGSTGTEWWGNWLSFGAWEGDVYRFEPDGTCQLAWRGN